ncbi:MAG: aminotransferase class V-fold PLP-dependent enzyme [Actinomycetia bacterium]|nr:aminotransferase class V-fold PLP-dependent enzyme [Actinomycetes bacterium]
MSDLFDAYPYQDRYAVLRSFPQDPRPSAQVLAELREMAREEDAVWESGQCSGTMYAGDHAHYDVLNEAFGMFSHSNALQRDMCPSATRFEGEIIAMALDLMHADALTGVTPAGMVTGGGSGSILQAVLAIRDHARATKGIERPSMVRPDSSHPAFVKAAHLFGLEIRTIPVDPGTTTVDPQQVADAVDDSTVVIVGSAGNYPFGTIDPIADLGQVALEHDIALHVDACLGGFILPFGEELGYDIPPFDFRVPGVTTISADTHKYGYGLKGSSTVLFRDKEIRNASYFLVPDWSGGKYYSPGLEGSRSVGLLAATWTSLVTTGRAGYLEHAKDIFATSAALQEVVREHPELRLLGDPTFLFAFTSDAFDIYHVADSMKEKGWRFNGLQYPNALHMAVTRPQTQPGVVDRFRTDLAEAVAFAKTQTEPPMSAAIYGGVPGGLTAEGAEFIETVMAQILDSQQAVPSP